MKYLKFGLIGFNTSILLGVMARENNQIIYLIILIGILITIPGIYGYLKFNTLKYSLYSFIGFLIYGIAIYLGIRS